MNATNKQLNLQNLMANLPPTAQGTRPIVELLQPQAPISLRRRLAKLMPGPTPQVLLLDSMSMCSGSRASSQLRSTERRRMEGEGAHSSGTTPSHSYRPWDQWTPPRPDMLLCPAKTNTCFLMLFLFFFGWIDCFWY